MTDSLVNQRAHVTYTWQLDCPNAGMDVITITKPQALSFEDARNKQTNKKTQCDSDD